MRYQIGPRPEDEMSPWYTAFGPLNIIYLDPGLRPGSASVQRGCCGRAHDATHGKMLAPQTFSISLTSSQPPFPEAGCPAWLPDMCAHLRAGRRFRSKYARRRPRHGTSPTLSSWPVTCQGPTGDRCPSNSTTADGLHHLYTSLPR